MQLQELLIFGGFIFGGLILSLFSNLLLLRFSKSLGIRNKNDVVIRWSNQSKPSLGGISFFVVFIFSAFAHSVFFLDENIFHDRIFVVLFSAGSLAFLMGLADDAYNTRPFAKLLVQILCGALFLLSEQSTIHIFHQPLVDGTLTIIWVVVVMNSLNMLDNMDGITGTTVFFILLAVLFCGGVKMEIWTLSLFAMIGGVLGFLFFNVHPSKLFMGDAGSQFIGLYAAFFGVKSLLNAGHDAHTESWMGIVLTLIVFTPAAADTLTVVINRLRRGQSPMVGGKDHTTHHLVYSGFNDFQVWMIFVVLGCLSFLFSLVVYHFIIQKKTLIVPFFLIFFLVVFFLLYRNTLKHSEKKRNYK